jgi:FMN reductase
VVTACGWRGAVTALTALRQVVHAPRGWPTSLGVAVNLAELSDGVAGAPTRPGLTRRIEVLASEMTAHARARSST